MSQSLYPNRALLLSLLLLLVMGCRKNPFGNTTGPNGNDDPGEITAVGTLVGTPVTKTIGAPGGTIISADGKFTLTIPADALTTNLDITIQPITNEAPGGIIGGYALLPNGTKFNKPVTLSYHYSDADINGSSPYFLYIATQDSTGAWIEDIIDRDLDTVGNIVSIPTSHFSSYVPASSLHFEFGQTAFHENESNFIKVVETFDNKDNGGAGNPNYLPFLPIHKKQQVPDNQVSHWGIVKKVPDTTAAGNITGTSGNVTFTAPSDIEKALSIKVSAEITGPFEVYIKTKKIILSKVILLGQIELIPDKLSYSVKIEYNQAGTNPCFIDNYTDGATLEVDVDKDIVTVTNIINQHPSTSPSSGSSSVGDETCKWIPDDIGLVNITGGSGKVTSFAPGVKSAYITLDQAAVFPTWETTDNSGNTTTVGGYPLPGFPQAIGIILKDSTQTTSAITPDAAGHLATGKITITPIH